GPATGAAPGGSARSRPERRHANRPGRRLGSGRHRARTGPSPHPLALHPGRSGPQRAPSPHGIDVQIAPDLRRSSGFSIESIGSRPAGWGQGGSGRPRASTAAGRHPSRNSRSPRKGDPPAPLVLTNAGSRGGQEPPTPGDPGARSSWDRSRVPPSGRAAGDGTPSIPVTDRKGRHLVGTAANRHTAPRP